MSVADDTLLRTIIRMPDVVTSEEQEVSDEELRAIVEATIQACQQLDAFRVQEGAILINDLLRRIDLIEQYRHEVEPFETSRVDVIKNRIRAGDDFLYRETRHHRGEGAPR